MIEIKNLAGAVIYRYDPDAAAKEACCEGECGVACALVQGIREGVSFARADLFGADLRWANLSGGDFTGADLRYAHMADAKLSRTKFDGALLEGIIYGHGDAFAMLHPSRIYEIRDATGSTLYRCQLPGWVAAKDERKKVRYAVEKAVAAGVSLHGAVLRDVDLSRMKMDKADFSGADFTGSNLTRSNCAESNFTGSCLEDANLTLSFFTGATLDSASMIRCCLDKASFYKASMRRTNLTRARVEWSFMDGADLTEATFAHAYLHDARFMQEANLTKTDFTCARMRNARLDTAVMDETNFTEADLSDIDIPAAAFAKATLDRAVGLAAA